MDSPFGHWFIQDHDHQRPALAVRRRVPTLRKVARIVRPGLADSIQRITGSFPTLVEIRKPRSAAFISDYLGVTGMEALTRVMGLLLVCIGIRFVATGLIEGLTDPRVIGPIVEAVRLAA